MGRLKVAVVDDDPDIGTLVEMTLRDMCDVTVMQRGDEGWAYIEANKPDLAILDLVMPGMDGLTILENIRANADTKAMKVIIITATTKGSELPDGFWQQGIDVDGFISKPFEPNQVLNMINKIMNP